MSNIILKVEEEISQIFSQYKLTCATCQDFITYQEKNQAIVDKDFHERFVHNDVILEEKKITFYEKEGGDQ